MMKFVNVNDIDSYKDKKVTIKGWVYNSRSSGKIGFLMLRDGFGIIQCIVEKNKLGDESFSLFKTLAIDLASLKAGIITANLCLSILDNHLFSNHRLQFYQVHHLYNSD